MTRFNHLNVPDQWHNYFTKYPQGYTILESLFNWVTQVDSMVDNVNTWNDYLDEFVAQFDTELQSTVEETLTEWQDSGLLDIILNTALQTQLDDLNVKIGLSATKTEVNNIVSGSPKGVYATLAALQAAYPTGTTGVYIVSADGKWYYWNGTSWTIGGTYQGTAIAEDSLTTPMMSKAMKKRTDFVNYRNVLKNSNFYDSTNWLTDGSFIIDSVTATMLSNSAKFDIVSGLYFLQQDIPKANIADGNYTFSLLTKTNDPNFNANISWGLIGYPTAANSGGTTLYSLADQKVWDYTKDTTGFQKTTFTFALANTQAYDHIRFYIQTRNANRTYWFSELYLGLTNALDNNFSYVYKTLGDLTKVTTNPLNGKTLYIDGDSISFGEGAAGGYGAFLSSDYGAIVTNGAVSGATLVTGTLNGDGSQRHHVVDSVNALVTQYDYMILSGGYNDYGNNIPLGTLSSGDYSFDAANDTTTVIGALESMFKKVLKSFPTTKVFFLITHRVNRTGTVLNTAGLSFEDYYNAIRSVCERYSIPVIDMYKKSRLVTALVELKPYTLASDGTHPTSDGYKTFYMPVIKKEMGI